MQSYYKSQDRAFTLLYGDCVELLNQFEFKFDMIFADPPYFLSNGGISVHAGKMVSVNKGDWDCSRGLDKDYEFNHYWLSACRDKLKDGGTIWVCGTHHNIFAIAHELNMLGFKILNCITWVKQNPPPNLSCRYFTHSTEFILWARKGKKASHKFNYDLMKQSNGGKQMKDVWVLPSIAQWEKSCGKHPTQKPLPLVARAILSCTNPQDWVLDPFCGSGTTGIAANLFGRRFLGIDSGQEYLDLSVCRKEELHNYKTKELYKNKICEKLNIPNNNEVGVLRDCESLYCELPF